MNYESYNALTKIQFPIGLKCITLTPTNGITICEVIDYQFITLSKQLTPVFQNLDDPKQEPFFCFGDIFKWSKELEDFIRNNNSDDIERFLRSIIRY